MRQQAQGPARRQAGLGRAWQGGGDAADPVRLQQVTDTLAPALDPSGDSVKACLKQHSEEAVAHRVFGVPSFEVDGRVFWGLDALPMLRAYLEGGEGFSQAEWDGVRAIPSAIPLRS